MPVFLTDMDHSNSEQFKKIVDRSITHVGLDDLSGITSIGSYAFYYCSSLSKVTIGDSVTSIGNSAFWGCSSLTEITILDSVTSIGNYAFRNCTSLTSVTIPDSVTSIGGYAFYYCSNLTSITINAITPPTLGGASAFSNTNDCPIYVPAGSVSTYQTTGNWVSLASRIQAIPS